MCKSVSRYGRAKLKNRFSWHSYAIHSYGGSVTKPHKPRMLNLGFDNHEEWAFLCRCRYRPWKRIKERYIYRLTSLRFTTVLQHLLLSVFMSHESEYRISYVAITDLHFYVLVAIWTPWLCHIQQERQAHVAPTRIDTRMVRSSTRYTKTGRKE